MSSGTEQTQRRHEDPQNGQLVQQLTQQAKCSVEVRRAQSNNDQQDPDHVNGRLDEFAIVFEQVDQEWRSDQKQYVANRIDEFSYVR